jgi:hypothetical protein
MDHPQRARIRAGMVGELREGRCESGLEDSWEDWRAIERVVMSCSERVCWTWSMGLSLWNRPECEISVAVLTRASRVCWLVLKWGGR